jgi:hypothetical protein
MSMTVRSRADMVRLLHEALAAGAGPAGDEVNEEHLAMLVTGQLDQLDDEPRRTLLRQVAGDEKLAALVRDLTTMGLGEATPALRGAPGAGVVVLRWVVRGVWAAAACLVLGLGIWRAVDPPRAGDVSDLPVGPMSTDGPSTSAPTEWPGEGSAASWRDTTLYVALGACAVLSIPVVWWAARGRRGR